MTTIDFYTHVSDRHKATAAIVGKALAMYGSVRVLTGDAATTDAIDRLLWLTPATGFIPHCRVDSPLAARTPVWVDHLLEHNGPAAALINLHPDPPPFFGRFERMAEIVGASEDDVAAGRERYRFYRERGYVLRAHNLSERR